LHGALSQGLRNRRLMALRQGQVQILVATDVAARGIDVPSISHVFNYGLPMKAEDYTHRIGRTGRAGRDGLAVTFAEFRDRRRIQDIESFSRQQFTSEVIPGLEPRERMPEFRRPSFGRDSQRPHAPRGRPAGGGFRGDDRGGDRGGFGGAPRHGSYDPHGGRPASPRPGRDFAAADDGFAPRRESRGDAGFAPRTGQGAPRGTQAAFGKPAGGPKVFVPRDAMKKRPARSGSR
jgi:superfamily II DNA/RNA helicase